jgi:hypothetical protein
MTIQIVLNEKGTPVGKVADAEIHFTEGVLAGMKLVGFAIWESQYRSGELRVTMPCREYQVGDERRRYDLVRAVEGNVAPEGHALKLAILAAYRAAYEGVVEPEEPMPRQVWRNAAQASTPRRTPAPYRPPTRQQPATRTPTPPRRPAPPSRATGTDDDYPF